MEYRGIQLAESVKLYNKDGSYKTRIKRGIDAFLDYMETSPYKIVGIYTGYGKPIEIKCDKGHVVPRIPSNIMLGTECSYCSGNSNEYAKEQFYERVKEWRYTVFEEYVDIETRLKGLCSKGHEITIRPSQLREGIGCCYQCRPVTQAIRLNEEAKKEFFLVVESNGHELLSDYETSAKKVLIDFNCKHEPHWITPSDYKSGCGCYECGREKVLEATEKTRLKAKKKFEKLVKENGHILLNEYTTKDGEVLIDFGCGHELKPVQAGNYSNGSRCYECGVDSRIEIQIKKARKRFIALVASNGHELVSPYETMKKKVWIDYKCGHGKQLIRASDYYYSGVFCPQCSESRGEKIIRDWLDENGIIHSKGKISSAKRWFYDIIIPSYNLIIEVHGLQHYEYVPFYHRGKRTLKREQENDRNKRRYAESLGYNYMIVDYREHKPKLALERFLDQFNPIQSNKQPQQYEQLTLF